MKPQKVLLNGYKNNERKKNNMDRKGKFIQVYSGKRFWPLDPKIDEVDIDDISHSLSKQCRFSGHTEFHYSVAQHCIHVSLFCNPAHALEGLMHDASEAYLVDFPRPVKSEFPKYFELENNIMKVISEKYKFIYPLPEDVTLADNQMLWVEKSKVMKPTLDWYQDTPVELTDEQKVIEIIRMSPPEAEDYFKSRFSFLYENRMKG